MEPSVFRNGAISSDALRNQVPKRTVIDLFAGCGGLSLGMEMAGFDPILVNELGTEAMQTYLANRPQFPLLRDKYQITDVKELLANGEERLDKLLADMRTDYGLNVAAGEVDLVVGGPPCQGYSGIGHRRSYSVERTSLPSNHLYEDMSRVIFRVQPRAFLFENVRGLLSARWTDGGEKGEIWRDVLRTFTTIPGYRRVEHRLVHARDYGVPQNRPRVLIIGIRDDVHTAGGVGVWAGSMFPRPSNRAPDLQDVIGDLIDPEYRPGGATATYPHAAQSETQRWLRTERGTDRVLGEGEAVTEHEYSNHSARVQEKFAYMLANGGLIPEHMKTKKFAQKVLSPKWGPSGPSITATSLADDYIHYAQPRALTVREWARLQTFPDWYAFSGKRTTGGIRRAGNPRVGIFERELPKYTQIGNAVPVFLARAIGDHINNILSKNILN
jgi:DNA (cytosine-5)-methyltransferase 1